MKRAQSMAQAAWSRPSLKISSWSCIGPRRRSSTTQINRNVSEDSLESSSTQRDATEPFLTTIDETTTVIEAEDSTPLSSSEGRIGNSDNYKSEITQEDNMNTDSDNDDDDDVMDHVRYQDRMTEVELWQQIERELYQEAESEGDDAVKEIREEEKAAIAEVSDDQSQSSIPNTKEVHRFFPAGRIMHIVTLIPDEADEESENRASSSSSDHSHEEEEEDAKVAIFLTPRSVYSKLRLSQSMIADHFMPVYRRQIEKLIRVLENEEIPDTLSIGEIH